MKANEYNKNDLQSVSNPIRDAKSVAKEWNKRSKRKLRKGVPRAALVGQVHKDYALGAVAIENLFIKYWNRRHSHPTVFRELGEAVHTMRYLRTLKNLLI